MTVEVLQVSASQSLPDAPLLKSQLPHINGSAKPCCLSFRSSKYFILFVICVAVFTDTFLYMLIIPIIPNTLVNRANVALGDVQKWISILLGSYAAAGLFTSLTVGYLVDRMSSRRGPLILSLCALTASTTMYSFGTTPLVLVAARAIQGASGSVVHIVGMALLTDTMGATSSGESMGWQSVAMMAGMLCGPLMGGLVFDFAGHFAVFGMAYVVLGLDIILRFVMIERKFAEKWLVETDFVSYGTNNDSNLVCSDLGLVAAQDQVNSSENPKVAMSTNQPVDISSPTLAPPGALALLSNPRLLVAIWAATICGVLLTSLESVLPLYVNSLFNWTPAEAGLLFMLLSPSFMISPYIGRVTDRNGPRNITMLGWMIGTAIWLAFCVVTKNTSLDKIMLCCLMLLFGLSNGLIYTPNLVEVSLAVEEMAQLSKSGFQSSDVIARAYSFHSIGYGIGAILGPFWGGGLNVRFGWPALCVSIVSVHVFSVWLTYSFSGGKVRRGVELR